MSIQLKARIRRRFSKKYGLLLAMLLTFVFGTWLLLRMRFGAASQPTLYLYAWSEYFPKEILTAFTKKTGIAVKYVTYESNEELLAKLKAYPRATYDLVVPSNYVVRKLWKADLIQAIPCEQLTQYSHLDQKFQTCQIDADHCYAVPYIWGVTGIAVDPDSVDSESVTGWKTLWEPRFRNRLLLLEDAKELFSMLEAVQAFEGADAPEVSQLLKSLKPNVLAFQADLTSYPFTTHEVGVGMLWNGAVVKAQQKGFQLAFVWPQEGALLWTDNFVIPKHARNVDAAMQFIDFILSPEVAARLTELTHFPVANASTQSLLPIALAEDPLLFPPSEVWDRTIWIKPVDPQKELEREMLLQEFKLFN